MASCQFPDVMLSHPFTLPERHAPYVRYSRKSALMAIIKHTWRSYKRPRTSNGSSRRLHEYLNPRGLQQAGYLDSACDLHGFKSRLAVSSSGSFRCQLASIKHAKCQSDSDRSHAHVPSRTFRRIIIRLLRHFSNEDQLMGCPPPSLTKLLHSVRRSSKVDRRYLEKNSQGTCCEVYGRCRDSVRRHLKQSADDFTSRLVTRSSCIPQAHADSSAIRLRLRIEIKRIAMIRSRSTMTEGYYAVL